MLKDLLITLLFLFPQSFLVAQSSPVYPKYYFRNPMGIPMELTANFGELRSNHWHMGLDIRTNQKVNLPVYAAADGYITKVRVEPFGFGRSIYINHPNGFTTVYGHLNDFFPALEQYVTGQQYKQESWSVEMDIPKDKFKVFKSQFIANSGNSGSSHGPHLHFEIRDTKTEKCLNPLLFGFLIQDNVPPEILKIGMYDRRQSVYDEDPQLFPLKKTKEGYVIPNTPVVKTGLNKISFAIRAQDRESKTGNPNGIYSAKIYFDEKPQVAFELDNIDYNESMFINAQIDYKLRNEEGSYLQHISVLPGDKEVVYRRFNGDGTIVLDDSDIHAVLIEVKDADMNTSIASFNIQYVDSLNKPVTIVASDQKLVPNKPNAVKKNDFEMEMPAECLYDTVRLLYSRSVSNEPNSLSASHIVNDPVIPVHSTFTVRIKPDKLVPQELKNKIIIQHNSSNSIRKAIWQGDPAGAGWLTARFGDFGSFQLFADTIPPEINELGNAGIKYSGGDTIDLSPSKNIFFSPKDNFGAIKNFRAELDGKWIRFTNDKGNTFIYNFDERCPYGVHHLKITAEDLVGNMTTKMWWFKRNPYTPPPPRKKTMKKANNRKGVVSRVKKQNAAIKKDATKQKK